MNTESKHLCMDLWYEPNQDIESITDKICEVVDKNFNVVKKCSHEFEPQGRTIVFILSESHFTVHTYPEHNYLTLDIYICNPNFNLLTIEEKILSIAEPMDYNISYTRRGVLE